MSPLSEAGQYRFILPAPALRRYVTTYYFFDLDSTSDLEVQDLLHPEWASARFLLAGEVTVPGLTAQIAKAVAQLAGSGIALPRRVPATITADALDILQKRGLVTGSGDRVTMAAGSADILAFYANSIAHHFPPAFTAQ